MLDLWRRAGAEPTRTDDPAALATLVARDPGALLLARDPDGVPVGSVIAGFDGWRGALYRLAVDPAWRRRGLGRALVAAGEIRLARLGVRRLAIVVAPDGPLGFWTALGYTPQPGLHRLVLALGPGGRA